MWDSIVKEIFGSKSVSKIDNFGKFLLIRQQKIYRAFNSDNEDLNLSCIYKKMSLKYYEHSFYEEFVNELNVKEEPLILKTNIN